MSNKERLKELLKKFRTPICKGLNAKIPNVDGLAEYLDRNGVSVIPRGAIVLTRDEIDALKDYEKKHGAGANGT